jgi:hypothetical protein
MARVIGPLDPSGIQNDAMDGIWHVFLVKEVIQSLKSTAALICIVSYFSSCSIVQSKADRFVFGVQTYDGMIVGEHSRDTDLDVRRIFSFLIIYYH